MPFVSHLLIPPDTIEERAYQTNIARHALDGNTLVVLPTGMGKTAVALRVAAERLALGKILMLAPTKPLVEQHFRYFSQNLLLEEGNVAMFTGSNPPGKRIEMWKAARLCISTPEVIKNDLIAERYTLHDVSLLIVDECHRTVGNYAYVFIAERYAATAAQPLILGMTASPGSDPEMVAEICSHLAIDIVESRVETDADVRPYVHEREIEYRTVDLPEDLWLALSVLNSMIEDRLSTLVDLGYRVPRREALSMKALNGIMAQIQSRMQQRDRTAYTAVSVHAELMKLKHGVFFRFHKFIKAEFLTCDQKSRIFTDIAGKRIVKSAEHPEPRFVVLRVVPNDFQKFGVRERRLSFPNGIPQLFRRQQPDDFIL